jgi:hypothetical protein
VSGWAVLDCWDGKVVIHRDNVSGVYANSPRVLVALRHGVSPVTGDRHLTVECGPDESPGDGLARVCGLLGIEVQR